MPVGRGGPPQNAQTTRELLHVYCDVLLAISGVPPFMAPPLPPYGRRKRAVLNLRKRTAIRWF